MDKKVYKLDLGGKELVVELCPLAMQTNGHCIVSCGETKVMCNVTMSKKPREGVDFFPLGVDFEEKMYSVGRIPGSYKKREGKGTDKAILTSRLIDRPLRPLFPKGFYNDVNVIVTALSVDPNIEPEVLGMVASSVALSISDIPFEGPTGSVCVGLIDGSFVINPTKIEQEKSDLHLMLAGTSDAILMVEAGANEVDEKTMIQAIDFGHTYIKKIVELQNKIVSEVGKPKADVPFYLLDEDKKAEVKAFAYEKLEKVYTEFDKFKRAELEDAVDKEIRERFETLYPDDMREIMDEVYKLKKQVVRNKIINTGVRPDGRGLKDIRNIWCDVGFLPRAHGSAVFTRGLTQVMTTLTLGMMAEAQEVEILDEKDQVKRYMHNYNMPGYSTGEAKPIKAPGRREIGHGALAERALIPVLPSEDEFPYAIRTVSEVLSSNGSTSQASVCGSTLALMDGGVPIKAPVAGIAMGLIKDKESGKVCVLSDIQGLEDFFGDMDFKVAGTEKGITAIQMDIKIKGIDENILTTALNQAKDGRAYILGKMLDVIDRPRTNISKYAPKIISFRIDTNKIKDVIGSGGKNINKIIDETGVKIDIDDDGLVCVSSRDDLMIAKAKELIMNYAEKVEVGKTYLAKVIRIEKFGAFVSFLGGNKEGLIHISKLSDKRVEKVEDVLRLGDDVEVEVIKIDEKNRIDLKLNKIILKDMK